MKKTIKILILEDDLETLSVIFKKLFESDYDFLPTVLSTYKQVEEFINKSNLNFDMILLDRDCGLGGSFHVLDIEKFGIEKVIGISSVPKYNEELLKRGVNKIINKKYNNLEGFGDKLISSVSNFIKL